MSESTAVAAPKKQSTEIGQLQMAGALEIQRRKSINEIYGQIESCEWGSGNSAVSGGALSKVARTSLAHFCRTLGAHPQMHVDLLGGKPYLKADYFYDTVQGNPHFVDFQQVDIASDDERRQHYGVPEFATHAYETVIRKLVPFAPIEKIRSGEITNWQSYVVEVREANSAGGMGRKMADAKKFDPIGDAYPGLTARSRSFRRCASRAFSTWKAQYEELVEKQERIIEAEFEIIQHDNAEQHALISGPQAVSTAAGEPEAAPAAGARPLPVEGEDDEGPDHEIVQEAVKEAQAQEDAFDAEDARKRFFATLNEVGIKGAARKKWAADNSFPESTKEWKQVDYDRAQEILVGPVRDEVLALCEAQGVDLAEVSRRVVQKDRPDFMKDWKAVLGSLQATAETDADAEEDDEL